nr:carbohydrate ABC transporter substrate-binding protein [Fervidobacterium sp.]
FAKFISFSPTGVTARLKIRENFKNASGQPEPSFIIPGTMHPTVIAKFNSMKIVPEGVKYLLRNLDKTFRGDLYKVVPGWDDAIWGVIYPAAEQIRGGTDPRTIVADVENKANQIISQANKDFSAKLSQVERDFIQTRKKIEGK